MNRTLHVFLILPVLLFKGEMRAGQCSVTRHETDTLERPLAIPSGSTPSIKENPQAIPALLASLQKKEHPEILIKKSVDVEAAMERYHQSARKEMAIEQAFTARYGEDQGSRFFISILVQRKRAEKAGLHEEVERLLNYFLKAKLCPTKETSCLFFMPNLENLHPGPDNSTIP